MVSSEAIKPPRGGDNGLLAIGRRNSSSSHIAVTPAAAVPAGSASHANGSSRDKTLPREERREIRKFKHESRRVNETSRSLMNLMSDQLDRDQKQNELLRAQLEQLKLSQAVATNKAAHDMQHQEELSKRASTVVVQPVTEAELRSVQAELAEIRADEQRKRAAYERDLEEVRESARALQKELGDGYVVDIP